MIFALVLIAISLGSAAARCDNACNGHGTCLFDDVCSCYDNWGLGLSLDSGDCSDRICPFELAWVDTPSSSGKFHKYAECAGKGICNRDSGECECFEGYGGKGCQRTECPSKCSGHGTCEYIEDISFAGDRIFANGFFDTEASHPSYYGWDKTKTRGCVCDAQYTDVDCSKRMCPYGTDVLDQRDNLLMSEKYQIQTIEFRAMNHTNFYEDLQGQTFALTFRSKLNETFTTIPIAFDVADTIDMANDIKLALLMLPNKVIDGVSVVVTKTPGTDHWVKADVTFTGDSVQGPQHLLDVEYIECADGCQPKITGLDIFAKTTSPSHRFHNPDSTSTNTSSSIEAQMSDFNSYECGRRGRCNYGTGLCECFSGYTGESCNELTTLV